jgi:hypothetical protein
VHAITKGHRVRIPISSETGTVLFRHGSPFANLLTIVIDGGDSGESGDSGDRKMVRDDLVEILDE